jgi:hypothetical protein
MVHEPARRLRVAAEERRLDQVGRREDGIEGMLASGSAY